MTQTIQIADIKVGERFRKDLGDIQGLADNISELGLLQPIVISESNELIAGHRRLEACKSLGWSEIPVNVVNLQDIVKGEIAENLVRKNFTASEMVEIKRALEPLEKAKALERQQSGGPAAESDRGRVSDRISAAIGVSRDTLSKAETIVQAAEENPEKYRVVLEEVDKGEISFNKAYEQVTEKPRRERTVKDMVFLPSEMFDALIQEIAESRESGKDRIRLLHDGHSVIGIDAIELAA